MQYGFDFSTGKEGYASLVIGEPNRQAVSLLQRDEQWPAAALCLVAPPRAGLTTLAHVWVSEGEGVLSRPTCFNRWSLPELDRVAAGRLAIDDAHEGLDDDALLHVLNRATEQAGKVLLTARTAPRLWGASNADLQSRLVSMPVITLDLPDADTLHARFESVCHHNHLGLPADVWAYLEKRVPRDYAAMEQIAEDLCAAVSGTGRGLTIPVARQILGDGDDGWAEDEDDDD